MDPTQQDRAKLSDASVSIEQQLDFLKKLLEKDERIKVAGIDIDGVLRGKVLSKEKFLSAVKSQGFAYCSVIFGWDLHDKTYEQVSFSRADNGFADILAKIDLSTYRRIPWENDIPFFLVEFQKPTNQQPLEFCPRSLLKKISSLIQQKCAGAATAGVEFEWFNFQETAETLVEKRHSNLKPLTPGMFGYSLLRPTLAQEYFYDIFDECARFGIQIEGLHTETGPGVYEAALRYGSAIDLADAGQLFKTSIKQLGQLVPKRHPGAQAVYPSFMAKPSSNLPGCSGHIHVSIVSANGDNLFYDPQDPKGMSSLFKHFLAGVLKCMPWCMPMYAPTINSYKRLVENYWAPVNVCWGGENRTAAVRVITPQITGANCCSPAGTRAEIRVPGADINAHIALAGIFASGLYGVESKLVLPPAIQGDVLKEEQLTGQKLERLPKSLGDAALKMRHPDSLAWKIFDPAFVEHYTGTRLEEWRQWERAVTTWETQRYFELI